MAYAYKNFVPEILSETINRELERKFVFAPDCNRQYEGNVSNKGDSVKILGVGKPTITNFSANEKIVLAAPETVSDTSVTMHVDQVATFNYEVDDIDKRQAVGGLVDVLAKEAAAGISNKMDSYIADLAKATGAVKADATRTQITKDNILNYIDTNLVKLYNNDVTPDSDIVIDVAPWFYMLLKQAYSALDTDNSKMLENGKVGRYGNVVVKMSNNVAKDTNGNSLIQLRTPKAIAFVNPVTHTEADRVQNEFADQIKGYSLYDAMIVRPKEMIILNCIAAV